MLLAVGDTDEGGEWGKLSWDAADFGFRFFDRGQGLVQFRCGMWQKTQGPLGEGGVCGRGGAGWETLRPWLGNFSASGPATVNQKGEKFLVEILTPLPFTSLPSPNALFSPNVEHLKLPSQWPRMAPVTLDCLVWMVPSLASEQLQIAWSSC